MSIFRTFFYLLFLAGCSFLTDCSSSTQPDVVSAQAQYLVLQHQLAGGWNTWDTRSVLRHVLLPHGVAVDLQLVASDDTHTRRFFIGDRQKDAAQLRPGAHSYNGYYTDIFATWNGMKLRIESAADSLTNVILITPQSGNKKGGKVIVSLQSLWQRENWFTVDSLHFNIQTLWQNLSIHGSAVGKFIQQHRQEIILSADEPIVINIGTSYDLSSATTYIAQHAHHFTEKHQATYGDCHDEYSAMQTILGWDNIYDPTIDRVITPVSRIWNVGWSNNSDLGGFVLFCWDTYLASIMLSTDSRELAYANAVEITRGITEAGFVPNFYTESNYKSRDRSQPPIGSLAVWMIYEKYREKWFLELVYTDLLRWNRWWDAARQTDGLLCWGSSPYEPTTFRYWELIGVNETYGGALESGLDNSPMYDNVSFDTLAHQQKLNDVGLNSLYIMDCRLLAEIAGELGQSHDVRELKKRAKKYAANLQTLWDEESSFYYNKRTDTKEFDRRTSPTNFYPLLAKVPTIEQAEAILKKHLLNPQEFWGKWVIPATPRNDSAFADNTYWRGRIWAPLNFLVYLGLRNYDTPKINNVRKQLAEKSRNLLLQSWNEYGYVFENYNTSTGAGDDKENSDKFYHWGALLGFIDLMEQGYYSLD
jgi:hypothetical protein